MLGPAVRDDVEPIAVSDSIEQLKQSEALKQGITEIIDRYALPDTTYEVLPTKWREPTFDSGDNPNIRLKGKVPFVYRMDNSVSFDDWITATIYEVPKVGN